MTEDNFKAELQTARDMLQLVRNQCTAAQNETVQIGAQFLAEQRKVEALTKRVAELEAKAGGPLPAGRVDANNRELAVVN